MNVLNLLETVSRIAAKSPSPRLAMKGLLEGTSRAAEEQDPGNEYSKALEKAIELLDKGLPPEEVLRQLRGM